MSQSALPLKDVFGNTANPHYFFESNTHVNALTLLSGDGQQTRNIRVLVGDPGSGKTLLLQCLLERWQSTALIARLLWTQLRRGEFLHYFLSELGVPRPSANVAEAQQQLGTVLEQHFSRGLQVVVLIDEAHDLNRSTLRGLAELLDFPLGRSKDLRVILAGLPSLAAMINSRSLQKVSERVALVAALTPLTPDESASYIRRRLELAGFRSDEYFSDAAIALIANMADGIPRQINNLCFELMYRNQQYPHGLIAPAMVLNGGLEEAEIWAQADSHELSPYTGLPIERPPAPNSEFSSQDRSSQSSTDPDEDFSTFVSEWFGYDRLGWSGTAGELATSLQRPEAGLMNILSSSSESLRSLGIQFSTIESYGHTSSVCLRALGPRKKMNVEHFIATEAPISEEQALTGGERGDPSIENDLAQMESSSESQNIVPGSDLQNDTIVPSAFEKTVSASVIDDFEGVPETRGWSLHRMIVPALLSIVALGLAIAITRTPLRHGLSPHYAQKTTISTQRMTAKDRNTMPVGNKPTPIISPPVPSKVRLLQAARSGDPNAQFDLGTAYVSGRGVPADAVTGCAWLTLAWANGNKRGESLIRDLTRRLDASQIARIRFDLGEMYADGIGVRPDKVTAYMWHFLADLSGEPKSRNAMARLSRTMTADQRSEAQARAYQWLRKHEQPSKRMGLPSS